MGKGFKKYFLLRQNEVGATIFAQIILNPEYFGVVEFNEEDHVISIEEKQNQIMRLLGSIFMIIKSNKLQKNSNLHQGESLKLRKSFGSI